MRKTQSAMEYLMTYGWAILAIAIVMVSLYSLGIFNTGSLQPTATPGSCRVIRTAAQVSLAGQCSNLIPKYVMAPGGNPPQYMTTANAGSSKMTNFTMVGWTYWNIGDFMDYAIVEENSCGLFGAGTAWQLDTCNCKFSANDISIGCGGVQTQSYKNIWEMVAASVYSNGTADIYVFATNGVESKSSFAYGSQIYLSSGAVFSGSWQGSGTYPMNGLIANVQMYNTSLDNTTIKALYREGVGGAPIDVKHLIGWWPLNGNANDYSGNDNQGTATNVSWDANWQSGYVSPTT